MPVTRPFPESVNRTLDLIYKRLTQRDDGLG